MGTQEERLAPSPLWHFLSFVSLKIVVAFPPRGGGRWIFAFAHPTESASRVFWVATILTILLTLYAIWGFRFTRGGRRFISDFVRSWPPRVGEFEVGITLGIALLLASIAIGFLFPSNVKDLGSTLAATDTDHFSLLVAYIVGSVCEEIQYRGYLLQQLAIRTRSTGTAVVSQAVVFAIAHGSGQGVSGYLTNCAIGLSFGLVAVHRKSLWPSITAHLLINIAAFVAGLR